MTPVGLLELTQAGDAESDSGLSTQWNHDPEIKMAGGGQMKANNWGLFDVHGNV